jgi:ParB family chromosome partitioning protein
METGQVDEVQTLIVRGKMSAGQARPLVSIPGKRTQIEAARTIVEDRLSARAAEKLTGKIRLGKSTVQAYSRQPKPV